MTFQLHAVLLLTSVRGQFDVPQDGADVGRKLAGLCRSGKRMKCAQLCSPRWKDALPKPLLLTQCTETCEYVVQTETSGRSRETVQCGTAARRAGVVFMSGKTSVQRESARDGCTYAQAQLLACATAATGGGESASAAVLQAAQQPAAPTTGLAAIKQADLVRERAVRQAKLEELAQELERSAAAPAAGGKAKLRGSAVAAQAAAQLQLDSAGSREGRLGLGLDGGAARAAAAKQAALDRRGAASDWRQEAAHAKAQLLEVLRSEMSAAKEQLLEHAAEHGYKRPEPQAPDRTAIFALLFWVTLAIVAAIAWKMKLHERVVDYLD